METIHVTRNEGIVTVTLDRAQKKNAFNSVMWDELLATFREIGASADDRVVVITGANGEFCSGADLSGGGVGGDRPQHQLAAMRHVGNVALALHRLPQPVIAKVRGVAVGAGCNMALGCDLVVADRTARFSQIFARRGLSLDFGGSWVLPRRIGLHRAKELAFTARKVPAQEACTLGLCCRVVPDDRLEAEAMELAKEIANSTTFALALTKNMFRQMASPTIEQLLDLEKLASVSARDTHDHKEAVAAFREKRPPKFS